MAAHVGPGVSGNTQSITTTALPIFSPVKHHRVILIQNIDATNPFWIGGSSESVLTAANGIRVPAGDSISFSIPPFAEVFAISGGTVEARFLALDGYSSF